MSSTFDNESDLARTRRARKIARVLAQAYPYAKCELDFDGPFQLLIATILSAQTTDVGVNKVTPVLFDRYPDPKSLGEARLEDVEQIVHSTGFFRNKSRAIIKVGSELTSRFHGEVPGNMKDLVSLPGVGRKTANVVLGHAFGVPGVTVDTHVGRLVRRWAWTDEHEPDAVERVIDDLIPRRDWTSFSDQTIFHGRRMCHAKRPACGVCPIARWCPDYGVGETDPAQARELLTYELAPGAAGAPSGLLKGIADPSVDVEKFAADPGPMRGRRKRA